MAEKEQQSMAPAAVVIYPRDAESASAAGRKKRNRCLLYAALFAVFQTGIIAVFSLTIMKVRAPRFRLRSAALTGLVVGTPASPSLAATVNAELEVRNSNFGRYEYPEGKVEFLYRGAPAGDAVVLGARANLRSSKRVEVAVDLNLGASAELARDLGAGILALNSRAKMRGRVEMFMVMKKKTNSVINCSMEIVIATQQLTNIVCK